MRPDYRSIARTACLVALGAALLAPLAAARDRVDGEDRWRDRRHQPPAPQPPPPPPLPPPQPPPPPPPVAADPLLPMLHRIHRYFRSHEVNGVTMDSRYPIDPSEAIRMGVVSQLLGYSELDKLCPGRFRGAILSRAHFLATRLDSVRSMTPFDGMLGYSLTQAWRATGDSVTHEAARTVLAELEAIPTWECVLNGGLMVALATADWSLLTGEGAAGVKTTAILQQLPPYQNADGSFPHWCWGSEDIHYTGWMGEELVLLGRMTGDPLIEPMLGRMAAFLDARLDSSGVSSYEGPCDATPGCVRYYDSQHSGCYYDYDTRDWTVEPAYTAQVLDHVGSADVGKVMRFLGTLENGGTFADKYGYIPPPDDPEYPWSIADTSVANMSINFWVLATMLTGRGPAALAGDDGLFHGDEIAVEPLPGPELPPGIDPMAVRRVRRVDEFLAQGRSPRAFAVAPAAAAARSATEPEGTGALSVSAEPSGARFRFALETPGPVRLELYDVAGRRLGTLARGPLGAGVHEIAWDGLDASGAAAPCGVYFARLEARGRSEVARFVRVR